VFDYNPQLGTGPTTMRILVLSDIHANLTALDAALQHAQGRWEKVACLGDLVGYGPDPNEVIVRLRELGAVTIRGNHDKVCCGLEDPEGFNPVARSAALWTREQLTAQNIEYLRDLPPGPVAMDGISIVHGALQDEDEYVFTSAQALEGLLDASTPLTFFGHTHVQGGFVLRSNRVDVLHLSPKPGEMVENLVVEPGAQYLLNPGSVGQSRDGDARAGFAIADLTGRRVEFWRVLYDIEAVQRRMTVAGLPEALIQRLASGR
jgi:predicted phosphodiesterase